MWAKLITTALLAIIGPASIYFLIKLWKARRIFVDMRKSGLPMLKHNFAFGHLMAVKFHIEKFPSNAHKQHAFGAMSRQFKSAHYVDMWPFSEPFLMVTSPTLAQQVVQTTPVAYEKPDALRKWFYPLAGGINMFDAPPQQWKPIRSLFGPGFSTAHLMTLVPSMVEQTLTYCETLRRHAREGDMFMLDPTTLRFIMDIIGKTVLNAELNTQKGWNPLSDALLSQVKWKISNQEVNPLGRLNFVRWIAEWYNGWQMDKYIHQELDKRFEFYKNNEGKLDDAGQFKSVIDLALSSYMSDPSRLKSKKLSPDFRKFATANIRMFLFSGHDSLGSTICYCYHLLHNNPETLERIRAEHDSVFGTDLSKLPSTLSSNPHLMNQLPYTEAVTKEVLRLFPPASSLRQGLPNINLTDEDGTQFPTENCLVWILHQEIQRNPKYWVRPLEFLPDRWLVSPDHELYPEVKGAWRAFEFGPRNCIGQALVMIEVKTVLAMTIREFDVKPAYEEWDGMRGVEGRMVDGERAYQCEEGSAHPVDGYPCRVSLA